jgi:hypothetical protein
LDEKRFVDRVIDDIISILSVIKTAPTSITIYLPADWKRELYAAVGGLGDLSKGNIMAICKKNPALQPHLKQIAQLSKDISKEIVQLQSASIRLPVVEAVAEVPSPDMKIIESETEMNALESLKDYISWKFNGATVNILKEDEIKESKEIYDPAGRAPKSLPMRPAIYVE